MFATQGYLGQSVLILFTIGIIAAAFSNSDSALTAMTTSVCIDLLNTDKDTEETARRKRKKSTPVPLHPAGFLYLPGGDAEQQKRD